MLTKILAPFAVLVILWLILPTLAIVPLSFNGVASFNLPVQGFSLQWYERVFSDPTWLRAIGASVSIALITMVVATITGTSAALGLSKLKFRGASLIQNYFLMPIIVPGIVVAVGLYSLYLRMGLLGTMPGFVFAHTVLALPFVILNVLTSLQGLDHRLPQAAASLGSSPLHAFFSVTLPLILPGVSAGAVFAFVTSFDEIILSLFIQSPMLQTLPVKIYLSATQNSDPTVAAVAVLTMLTSVTLIFILQRVTRKPQRSTP